MFVQSGDVLVNGEVELRRGKKLQPGDVVEVSGAGIFRVVDEEAFE